jgi:hypothetical protein
MAMYGILECTSKSRIQGTGIPFRRFPSNQVYTIHSKKHKETHTDQWVKVNEQTLELMERIGPIGSYEIELQVIKQLYGVSCTYPSLPLLQSDISTPVSYHAYTVDGETTEDRDDAISVDRLADNSGYRIGIHITDVTKHLSVDWLSWTEQRGSSTYWSNGTKPLLPPKLAHGTLSLTKGLSYPCLSLLLYYDTSFQLVKSEFDTNAHVAITHNLTYEQFNAHADIAVLRQLSGVLDATDVIAWCMMQYNLYLPQHYSNLLLRVQEEVSGSATYEFKGTHASFSNMPYCHATSPIRRFSDYYNQCVVHGIVPVDYTLSLETLQKRMTDIQQFHYRETVMCLAYQCRKEPLVVDAMVTVSEDERSILITSAQLGKRVRIPLHDSYYMEEICESLQEQEQILHRLELWGIIKNGMATLRIKKL